MPDGSENRYSYTENMFTRVSFLASHRLKGKKKTADYQGMLVLTRLL